MKEAFDNVAAMLKEMSFLLLESGVPEHQVRMPTGREPHEIKLELYVMAFDWLHRLYMGGAWLKVLKAKELRTQEIWDAYKAYGFRGLQEQTILEKAQDELRRAWRTGRPSFFGRVYKNETNQDDDQENPDGKRV